MNFQPDSIILRNQQAVESLENGTRKLVHYTSGENALSIIEGRTFWLRNAKCMNDFLEVEHGISLLIDVISRQNDGARRKRLIDLYDKVAPGAAQNAMDDFDGWSDTLRSSTYIGCLSLIDSEHNLGKLSMWRAYCPHDAGVALVMNATPFLAETTILNAFSSPILYLKDEKFAELIDSHLEHLEDQVSKLEKSKIDADELKSKLLWFFLTFAMSLKHPAFEEEEEWRIFYLPKMFPSNAIEQATATIAGIPQIVQKIPLKHDPDSGLIGADIPSLIHKIIIGPTEYPGILKDALAEALRGAGVEESETKIEISNIPLR